MPARLLYWHHHTDNDTLCQLRKVFVTLWCPGVTRRSGHFTHTGHYNPSHPSEKPCIRLSVIGIIVSLSFTTTTIVAFFWPKWSLITVGGPPHYGDPSLEKFWQFCNGMITLVWWVYKTIILVWWVYKTITLVLWVYKTIRPVWWVNKAFSTVWWMYKTITQCGNRIKLFHNYHIFFTNYIKNVLEQQLWFCS